MKRGLVVEGGAMRAIFTCGVLDALLDGKVEVDYFIGVSAGIANGVSYLSGQKHRGRDILIGYANDPRYMGTRNLFNHFCIGSAWTTGVINAIRNGSTSERANVRCKSKGD